MKLIKALSNLAEVIELTSQLEGEDKLNSDLNNAMERLDDLTRSNLLAADVRLSDGSLSLIKGSKSTLNGSDEYPLVAEIQRGEPDPEGGSAS